jgi:uroporphyrinogen-III synthase
MTAKPPAKKSVLVVRPLREQDAFLQLLHRAGISYSYKPIMRIVPVTEPVGEVERIRELILQFAQFDHAIFISANAAEQGDSLARSILAHAARCAAVCRGSADW